MIPELSIITPVHNVRQWLPACISSVLSQTFTDWELILVDDGSTDGSEDICDFYASKDGRIKVIHKPNAGVSAARNDGLGIARGRFLTFLDSDDEFGSETTIEENMKVFMTDPETDIVQFPWCEFRNGHEVKRHIPSREKVIRSRSEMITSLCYNKITYQVWQKIYRREVFGGIQFPVDMKIGEDVWCLIDVLKKTRKVCITGHGFYRYNIRETSAMRSKTDRCKYDEFRMSHRLFMELCSTAGVTDSARTYYFFIVIERMCIAQATGKYDLTDCFHEIRSFIPSLTRLFHRMKKNHKLYLLQTRLFDVDYLVDNLTRQMHRQAHA